MMKYMADVCVVGLGYVGLPLALLFAEAGKIVLGVDCSPEVVETLKNGTKRFDEPELAALFARASDRNIRFSLRVEPADIYILAVPTPQQEDTHKMEAGYLLSACKEVLDVCGNDTLIVIESTVAPGTVQRLLMPMAEKRCAKDGTRISFALVPERMLPGHALHELKNNPRVIGAENQETRSRVADLYRSICCGDIFYTDVRTAEMVKVAENTFRDINIAYANELALICRKAGVNVHEVIRLANFHPRVWILEPGPGVGGHCIPVDPWFLTADYPEETKLIRCARERNDGMTDYVLERVRKILSQKLRVGISQTGFYGLAYKENIADIRNSPGLRLASRFAQENEWPVFYDPYVDSRRCPEILRFASSMEEFLENTRLIVILTAHDVLMDYREEMKEKYVFDTRNMPWLDADEIL